MITISWRKLTDDDNGWRTKRCLYAYLAPSDKEILYIGKAWGVTVRNRWNRSGKEHFWDDLEKKRRIYEHAVIIGELILPLGKRLTHQLLADIESLLIIREQPWGNIQSMKSRISRPGLTIKCNGFWLGKKIYRDI